MGKSAKSRARTPRQRENQLINLAIDLAERQLTDGTATSQVITHFLKLATVKEELENEKLRSDLKVADAKIKALQTQEDVKILYEKAIASLKSYGAFSEKDEGVQDGSDY